MKGLNEARARAKQLKRKTKSELVAIINSIYGYELSSIPVKRDLIYDILGEEFNYDIAYHLWYTFLTK